RQFQQAVDANPEFGTGFLYLAKAKLDAGDLDGAETAVHQGLALSHDASIAPLAHYVLADVYSRRGRVKDAEREAAEGQRQEARLRDKGERGGASCPSSPFSAERPAANTARPASRRPRRSTCSSSRSTRCAPIGSVATEPLMWRRRTWIASPAKAGW